MNQSFNTAFDGGPGPAISNNGPPASGSKPTTDRTASLLNLLRFNPTTQPQDQSASMGMASSSSGAASNPSAQTVHARGVSASDLVASSMGKSTISVSQTNSPPPAPEAPTSPPANPQDYLLRLLNRDHPTVYQGLSSAPEPQSTKPTATLGDEKVELPLRGSNVLLERSTSIPRVVEGGSWIRKESPIRVFGTKESRETTPFDPQDLPKVEKPAEPIFTYVNPFEQLAASSPRNANKSRYSPPTREVSKLSKDGLNGESQKKKAKHRSPAKSPTRELTSSGNEILQSIETPDPIPIDRSRNNLEALLGLGAPTTDTETVTQALNDVGEQVNRQVQYAIAQAEEEEKELYTGEDLDEEQIESQLQDAALEVQRELKKSGNEGVLEEMLPSPLPEVVQEIIDEAAAGNVDGNHGSADDEISSGKADDDLTVPVYNFPLKPFVSIELIQPEAATLHLRESTITDIARLKKEFDQVDRTLATASNDYIVYAMPKPGGVRVIRQEDGIDRQIFKETRDHVFNVAISTAPSGREIFQELESFIATAISGTVYWSALRLMGEEHLLSDDIEKHSLVFPPVPAHDDNTSGGQLKTRAKKSTRHPEYFAIGRGKFIQIVFPLHAETSPHVKSRSILDTEKYFKDRSLRINMGKAGKDFVFSEDDTMIASLDKAGRLRFWDVRTLTDSSNGHASKIAPIEIKTPVLTFMTNQVNEKSWPTSILFVDKLRAYAKGQALRYVIVGMKQNHTLQLWDLGLGKVVQELNFPHEKESDAICSVAYHPSSGIVVVGHPTRNSIYFIHLSAPKYNLPNMKQAQYVERLANKDPGLPKTESTAIMSGMREFSFSSKGQLRSLDLLPVSNETVANKEDPGLFELYVMHSKGVTCLNIRKADLGWNEENKVIDARSAHDAGIINVKDLRETPAPIPSEPSSVNGEANSHPITRSASKKSQKAQESASKAVDKHLDEGLEAVPVPKTGEKPDRAEKRKKKNKASAASRATDDFSSVPPPAPPPPAPTAPPTYADTLRAVSPAPEASTSPSKDSARLPLSKRQPAEPSDMSLTEQKTKRAMANTDSISLGISHDFVDKELKKIEGAVSTEVSKVLVEQLDSLYTKLEDDRRISEAASAAKHDSILRLVSSVLTENVEKTLSRIILTNISQTVVPSVHNVTTSTLRKEIPVWLSKHLLDTLPAQLRLSLPEAVSNAVRNPDVLHVLSEQITDKITTQVEKQFANSLRQSIAPKFEGMATDALQKIAFESDQRMNDVVKGFIKKQKEDSAKIDKLTSAVHALTTTIHSMSSAQTDFQQEILRLQQQGTLARRPSVSEQSSHPIEGRSFKRESAEPEPEPAPARTAEEQELDLIVEYMTNGRFEDGTIMVGPSTVDSLSLLTIN